MIQVFLAIILALAALAQPSAGAACTDASAYADLPAALAAAQASAARCLDIPAGTYPLTTGLAATADGLEIRGAGEGKTVLQTQGVALTSELAVIRLFGIGQSVHDLTIRIGTGYSGAYGVGGISVYGSGALGTNAGRAERATIERVEITGGYSGDGGANGYGIATYRAYTDNNAAQFVTIRDCWIHDTPSQGIVVNSSYNTIEHNRIERITGTSLTHGIYAQGGYNLYQGNYVANVSGFSFHGWKKVPNLDASGDRYIGNTSIDPGVQHMIVSGTTSSGLPLTRSAFISGNVFRNSPGIQAGGLTSDAPAIIEGNTFDGVLKTGGTVLTVADGSDIHDNFIQNSSPIYINGASTLHHNSITANKAISPNGANSRAEANRITVLGSSGQGIAALGANTLVLNNDITITAPGAALKIYASATGLIARGNVLTASGGALYQDVPANGNNFILDNILR